MILSQLNMVASLMALCVILLIYKTYCYYNRKNSLLSMFHKMSIQLRIDIMALWWLSSVELLFFLKQEITQPLILALLFDLQCRVNMKMPLATKC